MANEARLDRRRVVPPSSATVFIYMGDLALWSVVMAWMFERGNRSTVAVAIHAGEHLDNVSRAPESEVRLRILRFMVLAIVAAVAARSLMAKTGAGGTEPVALVN